MHASGQAADVLGADGVLVGDDGQRGALGEPGQGLGVAGDGGLFDGLDAEFGEARQECARLTGAPGAVGVEEQRGVRGGLADRPDAGEVVLGSGDPPLTLRTVNPLSARARARRAAWTGDMMPRVRAVGAAGGAVVPRSACTGVPARLPTRSRRAASTAAATPGGVLAGRSLRSRWASRALSGVANRPRTRAATPSSRRIVAVSSP
ncbi:hypothetical protein SMD11_0826 [Streptomyces albireticuli]|uniref:Uncharacterized protein n=1 Tax=Streptomyces albireticuli TaxID=1940 RepID=A0A1Z2KWR9_9ACTN|nr:hypothetical protein SMD11_0826 [Streptomyces albireticuli]